MSKDNEKITGYEDIIKKISDVISAKIITDDEGQIKEIHVLASNRRNPKQIVRDIESAILAGFGAEIDHKKISVSQIHDEMEDNNHSPYRLKLKSVDFKSSGPLAEARVELVYGDGQEFQGMAKGAASTSNRYRLVAAATLFAVEEFLNGVCSFAVEDVLPITLAKREVIVAGVSMITNTNEEILVGSALVKKDYPDAVVKATLNALNRKLAVLNS